jgi:hypothetical protein
MILAQRVTELFTHSLFQPEEITPDGSRPLDESLLVTANGVRTNAGFHKERLELAREEVKAFLAQLPLNFRCDKNLPNAGGGWSFLQSCTQADGELWTGLHQVCEQLFLLGGALGYVHRMDALPAAFLPGGVPYFAIDLGLGAEQPPPTETLN